VPTSNAWRSSKACEYTIVSFQEFKLNTRDIIVILKDTLYTTSSPLPIPDPHGTRLPSNTLERHLIGSPIIDGVRNLVTNFSMAKLVGFPTSDFTFTYQKGVKNTSLVDLLLNKGVVDSHSLHKISHSFSKVVSSERTSIATGIAIVDNTRSAIQVGGHTPRVVLLIKVPKQWFLEFNSPKRWACLTPNYGNLCGKFALLMGA